ncbi:MAG: hypothetical protein Q9191_007524 [Dirinaria sp. TL-2023a]
MSTAPTTIPPPPPEEDDTYAGHTRFTLELEFVQSLSNPSYLNHLAASKTLQDPCFVAYLDYLRYFASPMLGLGHARIANYDTLLWQEYVKYLSYPGPTLRVLELLQQERFRNEVLDPGVVEALAREWMDASSKH